jgi:hypothetical protein
MQSLLQAAHCRRAKERQHEPWIEDGDINGLHGCNAVTRGKASERLHHEGGKSKEDASHSLQPSAARSVKANSN